MKRYWNELLDAQRYELEQTFRTTQTLVGVAAIETLATPAILVVPALAGGCATKQDWWPLRGRLRRFRRRGGLVVVLGSGFCLSATGKQARGRNFEGVYTSGGSNWLAHPVRFGDASKAASPKGYGFYVQHRLSGAPSGGVEVLEYATSEDRRLPLVIRYSDPGPDRPGAMLFINCWGWMRRDLLFHPRSDAVKLSQKRVERTFAKLRSLNRRALRETTKWIWRRTAARVDRLEALSGEQHRLSRAMGSEKDYQRLLANDYSLCLDVVCWRGLVRQEEDSLALLRDLQDGRLWTEPPHHKKKGRKGRLDLLLLPKDEGPPDATLSSLEEWLVGVDRGPVVWIELEAGHFHAAQMLTFFEENRHMLGARDYVVAVDRSPDDDPTVLGYARRLHEAGVSFLHVRVPQVFNRLEEHYAPLVHHSLRKRFTTEVIRGLMGG